MSEGTEKTREFQNYGGLTLKAIDKDTLEEFIFGAIPMRLFKYQEGAKITVEVWDEIAKFEDGLASGSKFNRTFDLTFDDLKNLYPDYVRLIENAFYEWLEIDRAKYDLESFDVNLTSLKIRAKASHKTNIGKVVEDETSDLEEFEQVKADYPELVQAYFALCWTHIKSNDSKLAKFNG